MHCRLADAIGFKRTSVQTPTSIPTLLTGAEQIVRELVPQTVPRLAEVEIRLLHYPLGDTDDHNRIIGRRNGRW